MIEKWKIKTENIGKTIEDKTNYEADNKLYEIINPIDFMHL
jgi:hypothetical protein